MRDKEGRSLITEAEKKRIDTQSIAATDRFQHARAEADLEINAEPLTKEEVWYVRNKHKIRQERHMDKVTLRQNCLRSTRN